MGWNGSGSFSRTNGTNTGTTVWQQDEAGAVDIEADRHDTHDQDLADGIEACLAKNGENAMTGDLDMGSNSITDAVNGTFSGDMTADTVTATTTLTMPDDTVATAKIVDDAVTTAKIVDDAVTYAKMQDVSATDKILGRATAGAGVVEEIACTSAGRALLDDASASAQRTTMGLGTAAVEADTKYNHRSNNLSDVANAGTARSNLGLGSLATLSSVNNGNWSGTDLSVANGGTGASAASGARTNLGIGSMATRDVTISTSDPSGTPDDGEIWIKREA